MRTRPNTVYQAPEAEHLAQLDLVVPFTTPALTAAALSTARRMGNGLNPGVRLLKVQLVPYPLDFSHPPIPLAFLQEQMRHFSDADASVHCEIVLTRDYADGLQSVLHSHSVVLLATRNRPWSTWTERLALKLRRAGHTVVLVADDMEPST